MDEQCLVDSIEFKADLNLSTRVMPVNERLEAP
jgi:hypothetical protein